MTDSIFFDTDCLSSFLWVKRQDIISKTYPDYRLVIPRYVYNEIYRLGIPYLRPIQNELLSMLKHNIIVIEDFDLCSQEYLDFNKLISHGDGGKIIGRGEASAIILAKKNNGILASNNLSDISEYIKKYHLKSITSTGILIKAYNDKIITLDEGEQIWCDMQKHERMMPYKNFKDAISNEKNE